MNLTDLQKRFVEHYLANCFNAAQAAKDAGYSQNSGVQPLDNINVLNAVKEELTRRAKSYQVDKAFVLAYLIQAINICFTTCIDEEGVECFKFPALIDKGLKCIEKIGRYLGMFGNVDRENGDMPEITVINGMDENEI